MSHRIQEEYNEDDDEDEESENEDFFDFLAPQNENINPQETEEETFGG